MYVCPASALTAGGGINAPRALGVGRLTFLVPVDLGKMGPDSTFRVGS